MNILSPKEFVNTFYKDIFQLLSKKFSRIGTKRPRNFREEVLRVYRQTDRSIKVFEDIAHSICLPLEEILLLLESSVKVAHKIYMDNSKLQGRKEEILRKRLNEEHTWSREMSHTLSKQAGAIKNKERIIVNQNRTIDQIRKEKEKNGNTTENTPKKPKKGSQSQKKERSEPILEIPMLIEDQDNKEKEKSRDIFFTIYRSIGQKKILGPIWPK
ncbi:hypothetical protein C1646_688728 [Rhizophagus diaphanus]|nr:hypothetical protein C1646_688728 [Rhizophagus diaphanus] [Rhizophagus sp. MUCL 43196]